MWQPSQHVSEAKAPDLNFKAAAPDPVSSSLDGIRQIEIYCKSFWESSKKFTFTWQQECLCTLLKTLGLDMLCTLHWLLL